MIKYRGTSVESEDSLLNDIKKDLDLPELCEVQPVTTKSSKHDWIIYSFYFIHLLFYPLAIERTLYFAQLMNKSILLIPTFIVGGVVSIVLSIALVSLRVDQINPLSTIQRKEAQRFTLVQYLLVLVAALLGSVILIAILNANVQIIAYNQNVNLLVMLTILVSLVLYIKVLNTQPISWYITEQPFWIRIEGKTAMHISSSLKLPSIRLLLWTTAIIILKIAKIFGDNWYYVYVFSAPVLAYFVFTYAKQEREETYTLIKSMLQQLRKSMLHPAVQISEDIPDIKTPRIQSGYSAIGSTETNKPSHTDILKTRFGYNKKSDPTITNVRWNPRSTAEHNIKKIWKQIETEKLQK